MWRWKGRNGHGAFWKGVLVLIPPAVSVLFRDGSRRTGEFNCENKALEIWIDTEIKRRSNLMLTVHMLEWGSSRRPRVFAQ